MQRKVWSARVLPGMLEEYIRRHNEIWPEMLVALREAGVTNYTIWNHGDILIGYYECPDLQASETYKAHSEVMKRWNKSMQGIMEMQKDECTGKTAVYRQIFEMM